MTRTIQTALAMLLLLVGVGCSPEGERARGGGRGADIGNSAPPILMHGTAEQRDAAARALAMILDKNRALAQRTASLKEALLPLIEARLADLGSATSVSTRLHLLLCLARLGHKLDPARLRTWLGLSDNDVKATTASGKKKTSVFNKPKAPKRR